MRLNKEFLGQAVISPCDDVIAASIGTWIIDYTVGKYGVDDGGNVLIAWRSVSDWEKPQFDQPTAFGYSTVKTSGQAKLKVEVGKKYQRPFNNAILINVYDGYLQEGDTITLTLGDTRYGSMGIHAQSFRESQHLFKVLVDPFGTSRFEMLPEYPVLKIVAGVANEIQVVLPSYVQTNQALELVVRCLDEWGNPCESFADTIDLELFRSDNTAIGIKESVKIQPNEGGFVRISMAAITSVGSYYVKAKCRAACMTCISNGCICVDKVDKNLFWGDAHGQTKFTVGTGTLDEYLQFAQGPAALDFTGWQGNDFEITEEKWARVKDKIRQYHQPGKFLTFLGYEWSGLTPGGGDHNIYYLDDDAPVYHSSQWLGKHAAVDSGFDRYPISELWEDFKDRDDAMAIPHIGGRYGNLDYYHPDIIPVVEIHSHHGTFEWFAKEAMRRELKVGFIATSDDHTCRPGLSYPLQRFEKSASFVSFDVKSGFTAVYADQLQKKDIWKAIKRRHCYATTFARIILDVNAHGCTMGDELATPNLPELNIHVVGTAPIDYIEVYRGYQVVERKTIYKTAKDQKKLVKLTWGGVRVKTRIKHADWSGTLSLDKGKFLSAKEIAFDRCDQGLKLVTNNVLQWESTTSGDVDGLVIDIDAEENATLHFHTDQIDLTIPVAEINEDVKRYEAGGINLHLEVGSVSEDYLSLEDDFSQYVAKVSYVDQSPELKENAYWVKVMQRDGHMAWSSPLFITYTPS